MERLSGGWEAAAEARQGGGGGFPWLLKSLGEKQTAGLVSSLFSQQRRFWLSLGRGDYRAAAVVTLWLTQGEEGWTWHRTLGLPSLGWKGALEGAGRCDCK